MTKILFAVAVVAFLAVFFTLRQGDHYKAFMARAAKTQALVLAKEARDTGQKNRRKEYWVTYRYTTNGSDLHNAQEQLEYEDLWQDIREGQKIDVYYDKEKPANSHIAAAIERRVGMADGLKNRTR